MLIQMDTLGEPLDPDLPILFYVANDIEPTRSPRKENQASLNVSAINGHCNVMGCRIIARRIFDLLEEDGALAKTCAAAGYPAAARTRPMINP